jgi:tetratricopeptide (TPR) repeat protein
MEQINSLEAISEDVVELLVFKIKNLARKQQRAVATAAFMRFKSDIERLLVLIKADAQKINHDELLKLLEDTMFEGLLLNSTGSKIYMFANNCVQKAAYSLLTKDSEKYNLLQLCLAESLLKSGNSSEGEDWMLFVATGHLNDLASHDMAPLDTAKLNLKVGEKVVKVSAFAKTLMYLNYAVKALAAVQSPWQTNYELTLQLYQAVADIEFCLGRYETGTEYCHLIIDNAKSDLERLKAQLLLAELLGRQSRHAEAVAVHAMALHQIGEVPKNFHTLNAAYSNRKVGRLFRKCSDFEVLLLPPVADACKRMLIRVYHCNKIAIVLVHPEIDSNEFQAWCFLKNSQCICQLWADLIWALGGRLQTRH